MSSFFRGQTHQKQKQQQLGPSINGVFALRSIVPPFDQLYHLEKTLPDAIPKTNNKNGDIRMSLLKKASNDPVPKTAPKSSSLSTSITKILKKEKEYEQSPSVIVEASFSASEDTNNNNASTTTATAVVIDSIKVHPNDVLCGQGAFVYSHFGNQRFRTTVTEYQQEWTSTTNVEKRDAVSRILARINDSGGRFLRSNNNTPTADSTWSKLSHPKTLTKIYQDMWNSGRQRRATKKIKTKCNESVSTKFDDDSNSSHEKSNNKNDSNLDNLKRKRSSKKSETNWNNKLLELTDYERKFKHTNVPNQYTQNKQLGGWVTTQRTEYRHIEEGKPSSLTKERINSLNKLGFVWKIYYTWDERLQQLVDFNNEFNHTNVPNQYTKNKPFGEWVAKQRYSYKLIEEGKPSSRSKDLTKGRIESLNKLGFVWLVGKGRRKATAPVLSSTAMSLLSSPSDDHKYDGYSNGSYTTGNNELCVVSSTSTSTSTSTPIPTSTSLSTSLGKEEKESSVATIGCASIVVAEEEEEDGYESNDSELYLII